jgi:hypothetical protein
MANVGGDQMNPGMSILPVPNANDLLGDRGRACRGQLDGLKFFVI